VLTSLRRSCAAEIWPAPMFRSGVHLFLQLLLSVRLGERRRTDGGRKDSDGRPMMAEASSVAGGGVVSRQVAGRWRENERSSCAQEAGTRVGRGRTERVSSERPYDHVGYQAHGGRSAYAQLGIRRYAASVTVVAGYARRFSRVKDWSFGKRGLQAARAAVMGADGVSYQPICGSTAHAAMGAGRPAIAFAYMALPSLTAYQIWARE